MTSLTQLRFDPALPWWAIVGGLVAVVGAIGHLLRSLPDDRDELDDGARV